MRGVAFLLGLIVLMVPCRPSIAQESGRIEGSVVLQSTGAPIPGVQIVLEGTSRGAVTDVQGAFTLSRVPAGRHTLTARFVGYQTESRTVDVPAGDTATVAFQLREEAIRLQDAVVSAIGERQDRSDLPVTIGFIDRDAIDRAKPIHPSDLMNRIAGRVFPYRAPHEFDE